MNDFETEIDADDTGIDEDDACACCAPEGARITDRESTTDRFVVESPALEAELPPDVQTALGAFLGDGAVETLGEWIDECRRRVGGGSIALADLCHTRERSAHRGELDGIAYHFACFYDAVVLAAIADAPVDIRTESPHGTVVEARAVGTDELTVTPEGAVFSFGIDRSAASTTDEPTLEDAYAAVCPYVRAFPTPNAYERWAAAVPAATVAMPLADATEIAAALVE